MKDLRNLPQPVLDRLAAHPVAGVDETIRYRGRPILTEARRRPLELRDDEGFDPEVEGYATVYDVWYEVAGGPPWGWMERIDSAAADKSLAARDDVRFLINHDGVPLARTASGTMTLTSDNVGLLAHATLDRRSPDTQTLLPAMERGDIDQMSFAFEVIEQTWDGDYTERTITELKLWDVSAVTYPANPATHIQLAETWITDPVPVRGFPLPVVYAIRDLLFFTS